MRSILNQEYKCDYFFFQDHLTFLKHDLIFFVFTYMCQNLYQVLYNSDEVKW